MKISPTEEESHLCLSDGNQRTYSCFYMPHHAVIKESSTTKVRVVFNASQRTDTQLALNDLVLVGPKLQNDLSTILLKWRQYKVGFSADIKQMYRQIRISSHDSNYQRIVWRSHPSEEIKDFNLHTVTFGVACAPYLAIKCLRKLAQSEEQNYPEAATVLLNNFYVDDVLSGADTEADALSLQKQLIDLLHSACFELRKWASNCSRLLERLPKEHIELQLPLTLDDNESVKALGLHWHPAEDTLRFRVTIPDVCDKLTKRLLLSEIAKLYDPAGFISPIIISAKIIMQKLWVLGLQWDDPLPEDIIREWIRLRKELKYLEHLRIPRWVGISKIRKYEVHGFCDASTKAYAAVAYLRVFNEDGTVSVRLLTSKSKVAPLKPTTLPRLELCGATMLAKLLTYVRSSLNISESSVLAWTDSMIVLAWIRGEPQKWKTFVCNRVVQIQELVNSKYWNHIESQHNPADCASRGSLPSELINNQLWWEGPSFLHNPQHKWTNPLTLDPVSTLEESRQISTFTAIVERRNVLNMLDFSSLQHLVRTTAYCLRFIKNSKTSLCTKNKQNPSECRETGHLTAKEIKLATEVCIKQVQLEDYAEEISLLNQKKPLPSTSHILKLNPILSNDGLLRVGGRLHNALIPFQEKHPILLPQKHHFTNLVIQEAHSVTLHGSQQLVMSYIRKKFWIVNARAIVRNVLHKCLACFRQRAETAQQLMGNLPKPRLKPSRPFTHTGIDYAGPVNIKTSKGRGQRSYKGYMAIFICLCTKAIHLEPVSDQSSASFIAAFKRFISRRGFCSHVYTDCGTNFVGAKSLMDIELKHCIKDAWGKTAEAFAFKGIEWHFIPPASPHFGGLWEAGVKSTKYHLKRILGNSCLTYEEWATVLAQIEACLNSRPLCPMTSDPSDLTALTPGHFLIGDSLLSAPEQDFSDIPTHRLTRWQYMQQLTQHYWKRWSSEYMTRLQERPKWARQTSNIQTGSLVLVKDTRMPPARWPLARVIETYPGSDGLIRVATVRTATTKLKRPVTKLCVLPIYNDIDSNNLVK